MPQYHWSHKGISINTISNRAILHYRRGFRWISCWYRYELPYFAPLIASEMKLIVNSPDSTSSGDLCLARFIGLSAFHARWITHAGTWRPDHHHWRPLWRPYYCISTVTGHQHFTLLFHFWIISLTYYRCWRRCVPCY
jgi:hypothetical protein